MRDRVAAVIGITGAAKRKLRTGLASQRIGRAARVTRLSGERVRINLELPATAGF
ncbi:hypothetical protein [Rhodocyclus tenuis]|uniref:Uncharacterized protein n=1 Tax=Rhodocyclus tenuis TaxID=1066 RepID=A0A840FVJ0_RHOTE|nr:hypothetical protein [Rhodocyclus tenuis]MBB4245734.1 hypothetical protein [Rhodocyclus tenuis]